MNLIGLMPVRNEAWILGLSARVALAWVDHLVILNHASTDATFPILEDLRAEYAEEVTTIQQPPGPWMEFSHRQRMLDEARRLDATHIALIDADEILTSNLLSTIRSMIERAPRKRMLELPLYNLRGGIHKYHANGIWGNRVVSVAFCDTPEAKWEGEGHHHREPHGVNWHERFYRPVLQGNGGVMHLWGASERRLIAKHALYKLTDKSKPRPQIDREYSWAIHGDPGNRNYGTPADWRYTPVPDAWWANYSDLIDHLDIDRIPWQEDAVRDILRADPMAGNGMDLFGLA